MRLFGVLVEDVAGITSHNQDEVAGQCKEERSKEAAANEDRWHFKHPQSPQMPAREYNAQEDQSGEGDQCHDDVELADGGADDVGHFVDADGGVDEAGDEEEEPSQLEQDLPKVAH